nr:putative disease resistance protein At4g11170 [Nicotiana tomentosiformis]
MVLPISYNVDPSEVRRQTGLFGEALAKHKEQSFGAQRMEKWTTALTEAANLRGWNLRNVVDGHESKFIECIVQQVANQTPLDVAWYPIGVDSRVKDIELLLQCASEDKVRMVGIYDVGGNEKTTLAKAIYNRIFRHFNGSCFLSDVRSETEEFGLVKLQQKLLQQILKTKAYRDGYSKMLKSNIALFFFSESAIATLVRKCLLQSTRPIEMHDLLRDMGRDQFNTPENGAEPSRSPRCSTRT